MLYDPTWEGLERIVGPWKWGGLEGAGVPSPKVQDVTNPHPTCLLRPREAPAVNNFPPPNPQHYPGPTRIWWAARGGEVGAISSNHFIKSLHMSGHLSNAIGENVCKQRSSFGLGWASGIRASKLWGAFLSLFWPAFFFFAIGLSGFCSAKPSLLINTNGRRGAEQAYGMPLQWQTQLHLSRWSRKWERKHKHAPFILVYAVVLNIPPAFYFELQRLVAFLVFRKHHKRETYDGALLVAIIDSVFPSLVCFVQNGDTNEIVSLWNHRHCAFQAHKHTSVAQLCSFGFLPFSLPTREKRCVENR